MGQELLITWQTFIFISFLNNLLIKGEGKKDQNSASQRDREGGGGRERRVWKGICNSFGNGLKRGIRQISILRIFFLMTVHLQPERHCKNSIKLV